MPLRAALLALATLAGAPGADATGLAARADDSGKEGYADSAGVKIHYRTWGKGPLVVLLHGFPDFWYSWRGQVPALSKHFTVVAIDLRAYNRSDKPKKVSD